MRVENMLHQRNAQLKERFEITATLKRLGNQQMIAAHSFNSYMNVYNLISIFETRLLLLFSYAP